VNSGNPDDVASMKIGAPKLIPNISGGLKV